MNAAGWVDRLRHRGQWLLLNLWPPFLAASIRIEHLDAEYRQLLVSVRPRWFNCNHIGAVLGGHLFLMTDPFYVLMLTKILGPDYLILDRKAQIQFYRPGMGKVQALFVLDDHDLAFIQTRLASGNSCNLHKEVEILDARNKLVAVVTKTMYIRCRH